MVCIHPELDSETRKISNTWIISSAKENLFLSESMFKWPIIVILEFFTLCCLVFLISFKKASAPFKERELLPFWIPWSISYSKLVKKALKFLTRTETPVSFKCSLLLLKCLFELMLLFRINGIPFLPHISSSVSFTSFALVL